MYNRRQARVVNIGGINIGGDNPITIQSMTTTPTADTAATTAQVRALVEAGCEIVRLTVNDAAAAEGFGVVKRAFPDVPLVADIHFDYRMALLAMEQGADKVRINPGNIGGRDRLEKVVNKAKARGIPIRVGINSGSLELDLVDKYGGVTAEGLAESALRNVQLLHDIGFDNIVVSVKAANVPMTIRAHEILSPLIDNPLHIGITEAGTLYSGTIKSTAGLAAMLTRGFGDTLRISLTADPVEEVRAAKELLQSLRLRTFGPEVVSCPTCGRTQIGLIEIATEVERRIAEAKITSPMTIAIMGCVVNGPGEAKEADIGIAGGKGAGILFKKGEVVKRLPEDGLIPALMDEIFELDKIMRRAT